MFISLSTAENHALRSGFLAARFTAGFFTRIFGMEMFCDATYITLLFLNDDTWWALLPLLS